MDGIVGIIFGSGIAASIIGLLLKKYLTPEVETLIGEAVENFAFWIFSLVTTFANKITANLWNKIVEPYFKAILNIILTRFLKGAVRGLDSDNKL